MSITNTIITIFNNNVKIQRQTSSLSFAGPNGNISPTNLAPPPVYTAQVIYHHISVFVLLNLYLGICNTKTVLIITKQSRFDKLEYKCLHSAKIGLAVQIKIYLFLIWPELKFKLLPISDFLRRPKRSPALSQVKNVLAENMKMGRIVIWEKTHLKSR